MVSTAKALLALTLIVSGTMFILNYDKFFPSSEKPTDSIGQVSGSFVGDGIKNYANDQRKMISPIAKLGKECHQPSDCYGLAGETTHAVCDDASGKCKAKDGILCASDEICKTGSYCHWKDRKCHAECQEDSHCHWDDWSTEWLVCNFGRCRGKDGMRCSEGTADERCRSNYCWCDGLSPLLCDSNGNNEYEAKGRRCKAPTSDECNEINDYWNERSRDNKQLCLEKVPPRCANYVEGKELCKKSI